VLGVAYLIRWQLTITSAVTLALMLVGSVGVLRALLRKDQSRCACLGTALKPADDNRDAGRGARNGGHGGRHARVGPLTIAGQLRQVYTVVSRLGRGRDEESGMSVPVHRLTVLAVSVLSLGTLFPSYVLAQPAPRATIAALSIAGFVRTAAGSAVPNARVTLFTPTLTLFYEVRTASNGSYRFPGGAFGSLRLGIAAPGFAYQEIGVFIEDAGQRRDVALFPESDIGRWDVIGSTAGEFFDASDIGIVLADGRIMYCHDTITPVTFNPVNSESFVAANSGLGQGCMNITLLADGRPIFVGGQPGSAPGSFRDAVRYVKTYNPTLNSWQRHADLLNTTGRWYPGMARLADGSLMVMGGGTRPDATRTATCERLDLTTMTWSWTGSMLNASEFTPTALLYTGEVLITWSPPQLYNPSSGQWRATGNFIQPARGWPDHSDHSMIVMADGRAVAIGIDRANGGPYSTMSELFNPATETWSLGTSPALLREKPFSCPTATCWSPRATPSFQTRACRTSAAW